MTAERAPESMLSLIFSTPNLALAPVIATILLIPLATARSALTSASCSTIPRLWIKARYWRESNLGRYDIVEIAQT